MKGGDMLDKGVSTLKKGALLPAPPLQVISERFIDYLIDYNY